MKLLVSMASTQGRNGSIESRGVTESRIEIASCKGAGHAACRTRTRDWRPGDHPGFALVLGSHLAGDVELGPRNVRMHIHAARHHNKARRVNYLVWRAESVSDRRTTRRIDDFTFRNPDVFNDAVNVIGR